MIIIVEVTGIFMYQCNYSRGGRKNNEYDEHHDNIATADEDHDNGEDHVGRNNK